MALKKIRNAREKIAAVLKQTDLTEKEIAKKTGFTTQAIRPHLAAFTELGILKQDENTKRYSLEIPKELKKSIIDICRSKKSLSELGGSLKEKFVKLQDEKVKKLVVDAETFKIIIDVLEHQGVIVEYPYPNNEKKYFTSATELRELGICHVCQEEIEDGEEVVQSVLVDKVPGEDSWRHAVEFHLRCFPKAHSDANEANGGEGIYSTSCDHCGLPLTENELHEVLRGQVGAVEFLTDYEVNEVEKRVWKNIILKIEEKFGKIDSNLEMELFKLYPKTRDLVTQGKTTSGFSIDLSSLKEKLKLKSKDSDIPEAYQFIISFDNPFWQLNDYRWNELTYSRISEFFGNYVYEGINDLWADIGELQEKMHLEPENVEEYEEQERQLYAEKGDIQMNVNERSEQVYTKIVEIRNDRKNKNQKLIEQLFLEDNPINKIYGKLRPILPEIERFSRPVYGKGMGVVVKKKGEKGRFSDYHPYCAKIIGDATR